MKLYRQPPVKGGRESLGIAILKEIERAVQQDVRKHRVSRGFVISTILAKHYGIDTQPDFSRYTPPERRSS